MFRVIIVLLSLLCLQCLHAQEIKGVEGRWLLANISREEAREKAIEEAKKEALRRAGIEERIRATEALSTFSANEQFEQIYSSFSSVELNGAVTRYNVVKDDLEKDKGDGQWYAVVVINATVKKYATAPDPELKIEVKGLRSNGYRKGEAITFSVRPNRDGYLKIFIFENFNIASMLFPNELEQNRVMRTGESIDFPTVGAIEYFAQKTTDQKQEHNLWVFVFTKSNIPFYGEVSYQSALEWKNNIEPYDRYVFIEPLLITE